MPGNVKYTNFLFLVKHLYIKSNKHINARGEEKKDFNTQIKKGR